VFFSRLDKDDGDNGESHGDSIGDYSDSGDNERATSQHRLQWNSVLDLPASHPTGVPAPTILRQPRYTVGTIPVNREAIANGCRFEELFDVVENYQRETDGPWNGKCNDTQCMLWKVAKYLHYADVQTPQIPKCEESVLEQLIPRMPDGLLSVFFSRLDKDDGDNGESHGDSIGDYSDSGDNGDDCLGLEQASTSSDLEEPVDVISEDSSAAQTRVPYHVPSDGLGSMWIFDLVYPEHATVRRSCRTAGRYRPGMYKV